MNRFFKQLITTLALVLLLAGCATKTFDLQTADIQPQMDRRLRLLEITETVEVELANQQTPRLTAGSVWQLLGSVSSGNVYRPQNASLAIIDDQIYEAYLIIAEQNSSLVGFYLPIKKAFFNLPAPLPLKVRQ